VNRVGGGRNYSSRDEGRQRKIGVMEHGPVAGEHKAGSKKQGWKVCMLGGTFEGWDLEKETNTEMRDGRSVSCL
jgi:hypothetical protein